MKTSLTGIKPTGMPHLGNLLGAIRPAINLVHDGFADQYLYFIADYHALTGNKDPKEFYENVYSVAATWLALGLDVDKAILYKQSDVPEIFELNWLLSTLAPKGDLNRAHSYKDKVAKNTEASRDPDQGVNMGLFCYPILMSADILLFNSTHVPVGKDQVQHVEIARSLAQRFNQLYGETITEPQEVLQEGGQYVPGLDGRKMSKSYNNSIPLFDTQKRLRKLINKITTDSSAPEDSKNPDDSLIMDLYRLFANQAEVSALSERYKTGIGWGEAKLELFNVVDRYLEKPREEYNRLMENRDEIDEILKAGAIKARAIAKKNIFEIRRKVGVIK